MPVVTCKSNATPPLPPVHPTPLCTCSCYRTLGIDLIHGRYLQLDTTAHSKGAFPSLDSAFAIFKSLKDYQATTVYENKVFFFFLNSSQGSQELSQSDFSGSSHGQEEAEERQGPMPIVTTHYQPGVVFFSSVPRAHIGHTTHKSSMSLFHLLKCKMV